MDHVEFRDQLAAQIDAYMALSAEVESDVWDTKRISMLLAELRALIAAHPGYSDLAAEVVLGQLATSGHRGFFALGPPGTQELLEYMTHFFRWTQVITRMTEVRDDADRAYRSGNSSAFDLRSRAQDVLAAAGNDWPNADLYE